MIPADSSTEPVSVSELAGTYRVNAVAVHYWTKMPGFPAVLYRVGRTQYFDGEAVGLWLRDNLPRVWLVGQFDDATWKQLQQLKAKPGDNTQVDQAALDALVLTAGAEVGLPRGAADDLLTLADIGALEGQLLHREPTAIETLRTYRNKGLLAQPERRADDGGHPPVDADAWTRTAAYRYLLTPRQSHSSRSRPASAPPPAEVPDLPAGNDDDLLGAAEIAALDAAGGQRKPLSPATLRTAAYLGPPDRRPGDGQLPAVDEPQWTRAKAYALIEKRRSKPTRRKPEVTLPAGKATDLFTRAEVRALDAQARGRREVSDAALDTYLSRGALPPPDRRPGDGKRPPVEEPKWSRRSVHAFILADRHFGADA
ncbi:MAG: hypothetical protein HOV68_05395 [Streptomycetaceae bacterium]|nr:hypothetical protein [Streptomycetaceae bacterium]